MKNFLKHFLTKTNLLVVAIFLIAMGIRFYNFDNRVTFWSEQARSLVVSADYIHNKPSLLGQPYFIREDKNSHILYSGALFNYSLIPLLLISNYDPVIITVFFTLLNVLTGLVIYFVAKKMFSISIATISSALFLFNDLMIYHSLFIWAYNLLPLVGILALYFSWRYIHKNSNLDIFILGLLSGFGVSLQFLFAPFALLVLIVNFVKSKKKLISTLLFGLGMILANLPMLIFDIRHNFYNLTTLFQYFLDTLGGKSNATFAYYYLLPLWPVFAILGAYLLVRIIKWNKGFGAILISLYLYLNLTSPNVSFLNPTGMPEGLKTVDIDKASKIIAYDATKDFNVAEVLDFDKRAYVLRYFTEFKYGKKPMGETEYQNLQLLYVLSQKDYNFEKSGIWEITSGGKYKINKLSDIGEGYSVYKLTK
jgi:hypothetical protein